MAGFDQTSLNSAVSTSITSFNNTIPDVVEEMFDGIEVPQDVKDKMIENFEKVFEKTTNSIMAVMYSKLNEIITNKAKVVIDSTVYRITYDN